MACSRRRPRPASSPRSLRHHAVIRSPMTSRETLYDDLLRAGGLSSTTRGRPLESVHGDDLDPQRPRSRITCSSRRSAMRRPSPISSAPGTARRRCSATRTLRSTTGTRWSCSPTWTTAGRAALRAAAALGRRGGARRRKGRGLTFERDHAARRSANPEMLARAALGYVTALGGFCSTRGSRSAAAAWAS
jgi:hypothetical protein